MVFENGNVITSHVQAEVSTVKDYRKWYMAVILVAVAVAVAVDVAVVISSPGPTPGPLSPGESALKSQLEYLLSDLSIFFDDASPQYATLAWLAEENGDIDQARLETRFALATVFFSTKGENWYDGLNFLSSDHKCGWTSEGQDVGCNDDDQVTSLIVDGNNLRGAIPKELMVLSNLEELCLSNNTYGAENHKPSISNPNILHSLGSLTNLKILDLSRNLLEYVIPSEFGQLTNLESLYLNHNRIKFVINIKELKSLTNLKHLVLNDNILLGFKDSDAMQDMVSLEEVNVARNIRFTVPENVTFATDLKILNLEHTEMQSSISTEIGRLTNLEQLFMGGTFRVYGPLPTEIGLLTSLQALDLKSNMLSGTVPSTMGAMISLFTVDFTGNQMDGELPTELGLLKSLRKWRCMEYCSDPRLALY
jgi:Leucine-rich repeat (LRR) protein